MPQTKATAFFNSWQTYRKVVAANYMYHSEIQADIEGLLRAQCGDRPFALLDLGCGDAATLAPLLLKLPVRSYKGVDLSEPALALAAENLKPLVGAIELLHRDILAALAEDGRVYDVIYSSFALHHLATEQKGLFFRLAAQRLAKDGMLLLTDVVREDDESLPVYLDRYCGRIRDGWSGLDAEEKASICDHIQNNDLPETFAQLQGLAAAAGLQEARAVAQYGWHRVLVFRSA